MAKYLDSTGLTYLWAKIKAWVQTYVSYGSGKITIGNNEVTVPTKTSDLTNDSGFITTGDIPEGAAASTSTPLMDGAAATGSELAFARGDHRHPSDTAKVDKTTTVNGHALSENVTVTKSDVSLGNVTNDAQVKRTEMGAANGVATLDSSGKVPSSQLPAYVDDVVEGYARSGQTALSQNWLATGSASGTVITPEAGVIYILMADSGDYAANTQYRWGGTTYVPIIDGNVSAITTAEIDAIVAN